MAEVDALTSAANVLDGDSVVADCAAGTAQAEAIAIDSRKTTKPSFLYAYPAGEACATLAAR